LDTEVKSSPLQVHTTDRMNFRSCRLRWHFSSNLRLNLRPEQTGDNLYFGSAIHKGLEAYYNNGKDIEPAVIAALDYLKYIHDTEWSGSEEATEQFSDQYLLAQGMLRHYHQVYQHDGLKMEMVEAKFEVPIGKCPDCGGSGHDEWEDDNSGPCPRCAGTGEVLYSFQIDGLVRDNRDRLWILEHKTASKIEDDTDYLQLDDQCTSYLWGMSVVRPDLKIEGVIYNTLRKIAPLPLRELKSGELSRDKSQPTTYHIAYKQLKEWWAPLDVPATYQEFLDYLEHRESSNLPLQYESPFFRRVPVRRTPQELQAEKAMIDMEVKEMLDPNLGIYRNPNRFNCGGCAFKAPCIAYTSGGDVQTLLDGSYISRD
jgi:PD-(D/E)XK nuclease superfamily